jgi:hypothetical protein
VSAGHFWALDHRLKGQHPKARRKLGSQSVRLVPLDVCMSKGFVFAQGFYKEDQIKSLRRGGALLIRGHETNFEERVESLEGHMARLLFSSGSIT